MVESRPNRVGDISGLKALVDGADWAPMGTGDDFAPQEATRAQRPKTQKARKHGPSNHGHGWFRTSDLSRVKRYIHPPENARFTCK